VNVQTTIIKRQQIQRLFGAIAKLLKSPVGIKARLLIASLLILMLGINGLNVVNSYVGRYFMSSIEKRDTEGFIRYAWLYVLVFAGSTLIAALFRYTEERLGLLWREWLTRRVTGIYMERRLYLCLGRNDALSNPDQRITEDIKQLTTTTLSFVLMVLNGTLTVFSFSGVLWAISPKLFGIAVVYALSGSALDLAGKTADPTELPPVGLRSQLPDRAHPHPRGRGQDQRHGRGVRRPRMSQRAPRQPD